jgi:hypothetical protein
LDEARPVDCEPVPRLRFRPARARRGDKPHYCEGHEEPLEASHAHHDRRTCRLVPSGLSQQACYRAAPTSKGQATAEGRRLLGIGQCWRSDQLAVATVMAQMRASRSLYAVAVLILAVGVLAAVFVVHTRYACDDGNPPFTTSRDVADAVCNAPGQDHPYLPPVADYRWAPRVAIVFIAIVLFSVVARVASSKEERGVEANDRTPGGRAAQPLD